MNAGLRVFALVVLILGLLCVYFGMDLTHTFSNRVMKQVAGTYPDHTKKYFVWGILLIVVGIGTFAATFFRRKK